MVEFAPSTGGLALWVKHHDLPPAVDAPAVTTDGNDAVLRRRLRGAAGRRNRPALVAHEVLHIALRHPQRYLDLRQLLGDVDLQLFNICADAIVNSSLSHLSWLRLPRGSVYLDAAAGRQRSASSRTSRRRLLEWDVERLYRAIDDREATPAERQQARRRAGRRRDESSEDGSDERGIAPIAANRGPRRTARARRACGRSAPTPCMDLVPAPDPNAPPEAEAAAGARGASACSAATPATALFDAARAARRPAARCARRGSRCCARSSRAAFRRSSTFVVAARALLYRQPGRVRHQPAPALRAGVQHRQGRAEARGDRRCLGLGR